MKKITAAVLSAILLVCALVALAACGSGETEAKTNVSIELVTDTKTVTVLVDSTRANTVFDLLTELKTQKKIEFESSQSDAGQSVTGLNGVALGGGTFKFYVKTPSQDSFTESTENVAQSAVVSGGSYQLAIENAAEAEAKTNVSLELVTDAKTVTVMVDSTRANTVFDLLTELKTEKKIEFESSQSDAGQSVTGLNGVALGSGVLKFYVKTPSQNSFTESTENVAQSAVVSGGSYRLAIENAAEAEAKTNVSLELITDVKTVIVMIDSTQAATVLDLLKELKTAGKIEYESVPSEFGEYLTSINGMQLAANEWVHISVKAAGSDVYEDATLGVSSLELAVGTSYRFDIQTF